jgi:hypothetical protein
VRFRWEGALEYSTKNQRRKRKDKEEKRIATKEESAKAKQKLYIFSDEAAVRCTVLFLVEAEPLLLDY